MFAGPIKEFRSDSLWRTKRPWSPIITGGWEVDVMPHEFATGGGYVGTVPNESQNLSENKRVTEM